MISLWNAGNGVERRRDCIGMKRMYGFSVRICDKTDLYDTDQIVAWR